MNTNPRECTYLNTLLLSLLGNHLLIDRWWNSPNRGFENQKPQDVEYNKVKSYLEWHCFH